MYPPVDSMVAVMVVEERFDDEMGVRYVYSCVCEWLCDGHEKSQSVG